MPEKEEPHKITKCLLKDLYFPFHSRYNWTDLETAIMIGNLETSTKGDQIQKGCNFEEDIKSSNEIENVELG